MYALVRVAEDTVLQTFHWLLEPGDFHMLRPRDLASENGRLHKRNTNSL